MNDQTPHDPAGDEHTRQLPPFDPPQAEPASSAPERPRRRGVVTAGVLVGALLVGGAAGVGGAAWYDAWEGDDTAAASSTSTGGGSVTATDASVRAGTVQQVAATVLPSVVKINVTGQNQAGSGSGIVLREDGTILTNNHVVEIAQGGGTITVNFNDGTTAKATIVGTDPVTDTAVIKAQDVEDLSPATIGHSDQLKVGQQVVAVGSPYGLNATVTSGIVSALHRPVSVATGEQEAPQSPFDQFDPFGQQQEQQQARPDQSTTYPAIQTDAAINPGNSGGPLVNMAGQVVGINSSIRTAGGSSGSIGLGFAIPIDEVLPIVNQIIDGETPTHARLGVTVSDLTGNAVQQGALVREVPRNGRAFDAGLKQGDVVTKVDDQVIDGADSLVATIRGHRPGDTVEISYVRNGDTKTVTVTLGSDAETKSS